MPKRRALTKAQLESLLALPVTEADLVRHWTLGDDDLALVDRRRRIHNQLGLRDRTTELQQHRASGLTLVTAAIVLWNTVYLGRALDALRCRGEVVPDALLAHIAPLGWQHINLTGDYLWGADAEIGADGFRALRGADTTIAEAA